MSSKIIVKRLGVISFAKFLAMFYFLLGLVIFAIAAAVLILIFVFSLVIPYIGGNTSMVSNILAGGVITLIMYAIGAIVMLLIYTAFGFIAGAIGAVIFNTVSKVSGGLELESVIEGEVKT